MTEDGKLWKDRRQENRWKKRGGDFQQTSWQVEAPATTTFLGDSPHRRSPRDSEGRRCSFCFVRGLFFGLRRSTRYSITMYYAAFWLIMFSNIFFCYFLWEKNCFTLFYCLSPIIQSSRRGWRTHLRVSLLLSSHGLWLLERWRTWSISATRMVHEAWPS